MNHFRPSSLSPIILVVALAGCTAHIDIGEVTESETKTDSGDPSSSPETGVTSDPMTSEGPELTTGTGAPGTTGGDPSTSGPGETTGGPGETSTDSSGGVSVSESTTGGNTTTGETTAGDTTAGDTTAGDTTAGDTTGGDPGLGDWTRYREILIDNGEATELKDFQVYVNLPYDSDMSPDFADLRFTDETGDVLLPHWIESSTAPVNALIWVRVPVIAADDITTIRVYYGNLDAASTSDGGATFLFFDDFDGASLDGATWKATAPVTVDFGQLNITKGSVYSIKPLAKYPDTLLESRMQWHNEGNQSGSSLVAAAGQGGATAHLIRNHSDVRIFDGKKYLVQQQVQDPSDAVVIMGIGMDAMDSYFYVNRFTLPTSFAVTMPIAYYGILGNSGGNAAGMSETRDVSHDWVLVRRFFATEPETFVGGEKKI